MQGDQSRQYLNTKLNPIIEKLIVDVILNKPEQVVDFMMHWLDTSGRKIEQQFKISPKKKQDSDSSDGSEEDEAPEELMDRNKLITQNKDKQNRTSVSAEAFGFYNQKGNFQPKVVKKTPEQTQRIRDRVSTSFMFQALEENDLKIVINAMEEVRFKAGQTIIKQGEDGDNLYVVDQGELDCFKSFKKGEQEKQIKTYQPGESFGELALLYNAPRAATIISKNDSILFSLDRNTFNHIVKDAASKKRSQYEQFLSRIEILQDIDPYEKLQIADALKSKKYKKGEYIVREGERGDTFYFLETGECVATKKGENESPEIVFQYKSGDYFGELALLRNAPRAASIIAQSDVNVVFLDRSSFQRLIGPIDGILRRNFKRYEKFMV